jgi:hypothetical protein
MIQAFHVAVFALLCSYASPAHAAAKTVEALESLSDQELAAEAKARCMQLTAYNKRRVEQGIGRLH